MGLLISTFLIGLGNGCTEAACNPMIADTYKGVEMSKMMNRFHMWFPGGIVIGALVSKFMTDAHMSWQAQIWVILIPTIAYAILFFGQTFPESSDAESKSLVGNIKAMFSPLFIFMFVCMTLTAVSEFIPQQWVGLILAKSGAQPMLILALVTGLMAVARFFGGSVIEKLDQTGVLVGSAVLATLGLFLLSTQTGGMAYVWPNMIGFVASKIPKSGALGMSVIGAAGMFSTSIWQPIIGALIASNNTAAAAKGLTGDELSLVSGQTSLRSMALFPSALIVLFIILFFWSKKTNSEKTA
jgi:fucose permease